MRRLLDQLARPLRLSIGHLGRRPRPFIIWTLQRTGGTNLASRLTARSGLPAIQHEPFNSDCLYGYVAGRWQADGDDRALAEAVTGIVARGAPIKHCLEMVPWTLSRVLADAACAAGYGHLFLYRRQPLQRLLSLRFATLSGLWGPDRPRPDDLAARVFAEPLPVAHLVEHERRCTALLNDAWRRVQARGGRPMALAYEDLYGGGMAPLAALRPILKGLGLSRGPADDRGFTDELLAAGDQRTRDLYTGFRGIDRLAEALVGVEPFTPRPAKGR